MFSKQEVESTESNIVLTALPYAANYSKFCSPFNNPFDNAKAVLSNYCSRDWLQWAPKGPLQRMGKNRSAKNIKAVDEILTNPDLTSVTMLVDSINSQVQDYSEDSSLLKRLVFICAMANIPYQIVKKDKKLVLELLEAPALGLVSNSIQTTTMTTDSSGLLLQSYRQYPLHPQYTKSQVIASEDLDYKGVMVTNDPAMLTPNKNYLYVVTLEGEVWFAPQFNGLTKLTHGGLARQAQLLSGGSNGNAVLSAGAISLGHNDAIFNLASGHFQPEFGAYIPLIEALMDKLPGYKLLLQRTYYKSLDERTCVEASLDLVEGIRNLKLNTLTYLQQVRSSPLVAIARKIFLSINTAGADYKEESVVFSEEELEALFKDKELSKIVCESLDYCPEAIQEYGKKLLPREETNFTL
ncbi:hypothetical protein [Legionella feeleii]|uniref:Uncharacterized protein n=1 Tax=Legionella feeleii TaxID=453 RepID=A0A0W0U7W0_9GAMM|nr:hypothetical protein [Legionella feeleii]KTD03873.1 hypothetical protein Lfee_0274 [Legionella feeleii]SPX61457.1 Uncharacterised protein [Legionella feeleii]